MKLDEMKTLTTQLRNATIAPVAAARVKLNQANQSDNSAAEDAALDELILWRQVSVTLNTALGALVELEHLRDKNFGVV